MKFRRNVNHALMALACASVLLSGCVTDFGNTNDVTTQSTDATAEVLKLNAKTRSQPLWQALGAVGENNFEEANDILNAALSISPSNADMHFLNAYIYEIRGRQEGYNTAEMASAGYQAALNIDPTHWPAAYRLGLWHLSKREYGIALKWLGEAALLKGDSVDIFNALAIASYHNFDPQAAKAFLQKAAELGGDTSDNVRARAVVHAALDDQDEATKYYAMYQSLAPELEVKRLKDRLSHWSGFHDSQSNEWRGADI